MSTCRCPRHAPRTARHALLQLLVGPIVIFAAPKDLNTPREFPAIQSAAEWKTRSTEIREQVLVSCGLWPMPEKTPLQAHVFGRVERDGYSIEKVYFQSSPGFYMGGNLYRPLGHGKGPFPAILNPHGHWKEGRMADTKDGSIAARCITFARLGMIAFTYDMVGFNDTFFPDYGDVPPDKFYLRHRRFATNEVCQLWNISQMGLQTWDSIRALDFLESLPDVDRKRLSITGESGGGTQTFMLGAIEDRLAVQAPIVMVSHTMQGGCSCENAPGLRVEYSNMEIAAAAAPRPQILVAATGDWTRATLTVEGPAIAHIYELLKTPEKLKYVRFDYNHNYNQTSREAVYDWFQRWLLHAKTDAAPFHEPPYQKEPDAELRVWPDGKLPADALTEKQFTDSLIQRRQEQLDHLMPRNKASLEEWKKLMLPAWRRTFQLGAQDQSKPAWSLGRSTDSFQSASLDLRQSDTESLLRAICFVPPPGADRTSGSAEARSSRPRHFPSGKPSPINFPQKTVVLADPSGAGCDDAGNPIGLAKKLLAQGYGVAVVKTFSTNEPANPFTNFYTTYNRTECQLRVRDLISLCSQIRAVTEGNHPSGRVILCGSGRAGLWSLLAASAADAVIADVDQFAFSGDAALLASGLFCPGIRNIGAFEGCALLAAPHSLLLHNIGSAFPTKALDTAYKAVGANKLRVETTMLAEEQLVGRMGDF